MVDLAAARPCSLPATPLGESECPSVRRDSIGGAADLPRPGIDASLSGEAAPWSFQSRLMPLAQQPQGLYADMLGLEDFSHALPISASRLPGGGMTDTIPGESFWRRLRASEQHRHWAAPPPLHLPQVMSRRHPIPAAVDDRRRPAPARRSAYKFVYGDRELTLTSTPLERSFSVLLPPRVSRLTATAGKQIDFGFRVSAESWPL